MEENEPERELQALQDQADALADDITRVREDWDAKQADGSVPGAGGDPLAAASDHPEAQFPAVGDSGEFEEEHPDAGERLDPADPDNEDL